MAYWDELPSSSTNLRLYEKGIGWRQHDDVKDEQGKATFVGSNRDIERSLSAALNASNLLVLTGAGSSFCARNPAGGATAPSMPGLWEAVEAAVTPKVLAKIIGLIPNAADLNKNIEKLLTLCKLYVALFNHENSKKVGKFIASAESAILKRVDFINHETDITSHRAFVRKLARRGIRKPRAKIFTTNYDLCFEYAAQQQQFIVMDGFSRSTPQVYDRAHFSYDIVRREGGDAPDFIENVFQLYKLHGSLDWRRKGTAIVRSRVESDGDPALIFPRDSKYQEAFESPYLDMLGALQSALREPDAALIVSGFGFNDDHISKPIFAAIEANMSLRVIVCDLAFLADESLETEEPVLPADAVGRSTNAYFKGLRSLVDAGDDRITLINGRFDDLSAGLPDLISQTERERHTTRIQELRESLGA